MVVEGGTRFSLWAGVVELEAARNSAVSPLGAGKAWSSCLDSGSTVYYHIPWASPTAQSSLSSFIIWQGLDSSCLADGGITDIQLLDPQTAVSWVVVYMR